MIAGLGIVGIALLRVTARKPGTTSDEHPVMARSGAWHDSSPHEADVWRRRRADSAGGLRETLPARAASLVRDGPLQVMAREHEAAAQIRAVRQVSLKA